MFVKLVSAGRTDVGRVRQSNQDQFLISDLHKSMLIHESSLHRDGEPRLYGRSFGRMLMVADGMGGHQAGSRASVLAIDLVMNQLVNGMRWPTRVDADEEERFVSDLKSMFETAHHLIVREANSQEDLRGMGTTLTMCYILWPLMYVVHVGDSRCYLIRDGKCEQLTRDHTVSSQLAEKAGLSPEQAEASKWSNVLYNALGAGGIEVTVEVRKVSLQFNDLIVLCSDGLYRHVKSPDIVDILQREPELTDACRNLIELANSRGGKDNITVLATRCLHASPDQKPPTHVGAESTLDRSLGGSKEYDLSVTEELSVPTTRPLTGADTIDHQPQE